MPDPVRSDVHVNRPLTSISIAFMQEPGAFVADRVFPNIPVLKQADRYFEYDRADFFRNTMERRAPSTESAGSGWNIKNTSTYFADVWALHKDIDDQIRSNADAPINMDMDATLYLSQMAMINREVEWVAAFFATSLWTGIDGTNGDITGVAASPSGNNVVQWNDATSTPIEDVADQSTNIQRLTGFRPQKLILGREVWDQLKNHPDLIDRVKASGGVSNAVPAQMSKAAVAMLMEVDEILVADGIQATSDENESFEASLTTAFIAGKEALLVYAAPRPGLLVPSGGYTFSWTGLLGAGAMGNRMNRFRMKALKSDRIEIEMAYDQKLIASDCGVFFTTIVA